VEADFKRQRLDCAQLADPVVQWGVVLHDPQKANEAFLLSLRDCIPALAATHPLKQWFAGQGKKRGPEPTAKIHQTLEGELKGVWESDHALTQPQRRSLIHLLDELEKWPAYLDFITLRAVGYVKLGNKARAEKLLMDWLNLDIHERVASTPKRGDTLGRMTTALAADLFGSLATGLAGNVVVDAFFQGVREFYSQPEIVEEAQDHQELEEEELLSKLELQYHQGRLPVFSAWMLNREFQGSRRRRYLDHLFRESAVAKLTWVFLGRLPDDAQGKEVLARELILIKDKQPLLFFELARQEEMLGSLTRLAPALTRNLLKDHRHMLQKAFREDPRNAWVLSGLILLGEYDPEMLQVLSQR